MPYTTNAALPSSVRNHLPEHAQDIYRGAFNNAFAAHAGDPRQEEDAVGADKTDKAIARDRERDVLEC